MNLDHPVAIRVRALSKTFGSGALAFQALAGVDVDVPKGQLLMLAGPSGSGKTTLLSIIGCVLSATSGEVRLFDEDVTRLSQKDLAPLRLQSIGFVFQGHNLIASLTARENIGLVPRMCGQSASEADRVARDLLERVGLADKAESLPSELSGGQRQRVAIARALAADPPLILADEPTAALDAKSGLMVTELLRELNRERGVTVVVVTHDNRIFHLADKIIHIADGHIVEHTEAA